MRKFFISSIVIMGFLGYSLYQRVFGTQAMPVITPQGITSIQPTAPVSPSPIPTQGSVPTGSVVPLVQNTPTPRPTAASGYKDGTYRGSVVDAFYGYIQVQATIASGKIANVQFLQYPNDRGTSIEINQQADPMLAQEAIQGQTANVAIISGATDSSQAFIQSMQSALRKAKS